MFRIIVFAAFAMSTVSAESSELKIFDFTSENADISTWTEQSDTLRSVGMSKAVLTLQKTQIFSRAIFFSLLNPQPNGAGFAGMRTKTHLNLNSYKHLSLKIRGQGNNLSYKIVLRHKGENDEPFPSYCQVFEAPSGVFQVVHLSLDNFEADYRGKLVPDAQPLDTSQITSLGIQVYGGVYQPTKHFGASSLEIDWIAATN